jgi:hypothetical protein
MSSPGASEHQDAPLGTPAPCRNCGAALSGRFCANCGQAADIHVPSTRELIHEALEGITHSDSRLWRTLSLLWFKPGKLTQEFVAGRRAKYLPPFRLYLVLSVIFFLVASFSHTRVKMAEMRNGKIHVVTSQAGCSEIQFELFGSPAWGQRLRHGCEAAVRDGGAGVLHVAVGAMPKAMFIFLPLIALLHMLLYWRPRYRYAEHLLFFLYLHAFFFSVMTLVILSADAAGAWPRLSPVLSLVPLLLWSLPVYTVLAIRRVFGGSWTRTLVKASALFVVYMVVLAITLAGVFVYAMLQL